ncbi:hypothetical protein JVT61DRAFT_1530 [Boletus reticuloceps]|uniref:C2H2-type domain-containing protein n=1 Tax=Boletus reticuloceps TaxID=495285 RepID=A0A8I2YQF8_9AGAM|nr:hypothetical protein JVT61DRAFT_1530 [Boletus reticuloceps]
MSQDAQPHLSLLSLSIAAANAAPIIPAESAPSRSSQGRGMTTNTTKHRRLSSAGRSRRRLSDARDAATRPFPTSVQTASASFAALSLSSPAVSHRPVHGAQPIQVPRAASAKGTSEPDPASVDDSHLSVSPPQSHTTIPSNSVNGIKSGRKRGTIFTCESCSKVYRHPSCLIKHRWEHTLQWREASKFVLSKHQQVQLLEAAAILSHLSPSSASLPEDRSLWPSFLSGGLVPPPVSMLSNGVGTTSTTTTTATSQVASASSTDASFPVSSSVPASTLLSSCSGSTGPRLHGWAGIGATQVRPGMLGVPTVPMQVPAQQTTMRTTREDDALNLLALRSASVTSGSWVSSASASASASNPLSSSSSHARAHSHSLSYSHSHSLSASHAPKERERRRSIAYEYGLVSGGYDYKSGSAAYTYAPNSNGGWFLPRSSVRSKSGSSGSRSRSQSASESRSDDEDEAVFRDVDVGVGVHLDGQIDVEDGTDGARVRPKVYGSRVCAWKTEDGDSGVTDLSLREDEQEDAQDEKNVKREPEQTWDGMEMEMEMD